MAKLQLEHQNMMQMTTVRLHDLLPTQFAPKNRNQRIRDRNEQCQNRKTQRNERRRLETKQRKRRNRKAHELRTAIAHEDRCRMKVIRKKAQNCAAQRQRNDAHVTASHEITDQADGCRHNRTDARRQAIETINQIDRIRHTDQPQKREDPDNDSVGNMQRQNMNLIQRQRTDRQRRRSPGHLKQQLHLRRKIIDIIQKATEEDNCRTDQDTVQLRIRPPQHRQRHIERRHNRRTADAHDLAMMHGPRIFFSIDAELPANPLAHRNQTHRNDKRKNEIRQRTKHKIHPLFPSFCKFSNYTMKGSVHPTLPRVTHAIDIRPRMNSASIHPREAARIQYSTCAFATRPFFRNR